MNKRFYNQTIKCNTGEIAKGYNAYLNTEHWKGLRVQVAEKVDYTCIRCAGIFRDSFTIHHNSYKRLGHEKLSDLSFYCRKCHTIIHDDRKNKKDFNKQYGSLISSKMVDFNEEEIEQVLEFIEIIIDGDPVKARNKKIQENKNKKKMAKLERKRKP